MFNWKACGSVACDSAAVGSQAAASSRFARVAYTTGGLTSVLVAFAGVFLPGVPTTGPLILASFLLAKGNPRLQQQLLRCRFFRSYFEYLDGTTEMPWKARCWAIAWMWGGITASSVLFCYRWSFGGYLAAVCVVAGLIGTWVILRFRANPKPVGMAPEMFPARDSTWDEADCLDEVESLVRTLHGKASAPVERPVAIERPVALTSR